MVQALLQISSGTSSVEEVFQLLRSRHLMGKGEDAMKLVRLLLLVGGVAVVVAVGIATFGAQSAQRTNVDPPRPTPLEGALAVKAHDHCWYSVKSHSDFAKAAARGPAPSSTGGGVQRLGDLILVTGAIEPAVGDDRYFECALYEYTEGSPVVVFSTTSTSPPRTDALIPLGFTSDGKKQ